MASEKNMGENSDMGSIFVPKAVSDMLAQVSMIHGFSDKSSKLDFLVLSLEEEMRKIDAFKRELPHCMHLLRDAIEALNKEKMELKGREKGPVMEDLDGGSKPSNDIREKRSWMSCVQLWSTPIQYENSFDTKAQNSILPLKSCFEKEEEGRGYGCNLSKRRGAFVPFRRKEEKGGDVEGGSVAVAVAVAEVRSIDLNVKDRKQRRCWSPELHKRFVDALLHLGGPQIATPKQIRELMNVDGLTNDEVKSHLQKYRLHIRKLPSTCANYPWWLNNERGESSKRVGGSPKDHLREGASASARGGSAPRGDSMEDDDDDDKQRTWKGRF